MGTTGPRGFAQTDLSRLTPSSRTILPEQVWPSNGEDQGWPVGFWPTSRKKSGGNFTEKLNGATQFTSSEIPLFFHKTLNGRNEDNRRSIISYLLQSVAEVGRIERRKLLRIRSARLRIRWNIQEGPEMLAASICCEIYYTVLPNTTMASRVPRCLFGKPDPRETMEMFQEALDAERSKFAKRWGVDPCSEDKENNYQRRNNEKSEPSTNKKRSNPYSRQTSIHGEQHFSRKISTRILLINSTEIRRMLAYVCMSYKAYSIINMPVNGQYVKIYHECMYQARKKMGFFAIFLISTMFLNLMRATGLKISLTHNSIYGMPL